MSDEPKKEVWYSEDLQDIAECFEYDIEELRLLVDPDDTFIKLAITNLEAAVYWIGRADSANKPDDPEPEDETLN